jgi:hypothetical protein
MVSIDHDTILVQGSKPDEAAQSAVLEAIAAEWTAARDEKIAIQQQRLKLAEREREIDRKMADCEAAARVFRVSNPFADAGLTAETSVPNLAVRTFRKWFGRNGADPDATPEVITAELVSFPSEIDPQILAADERISEVIEQLMTMSQPAPRPAIRDIVMDQLKAAGGAGTRTALILNHIETTFGDDVSAKAVGMTLNRLQKEGLARREGHTWFYVPPQTATTALAVSRAHP